MRALGQVQHIVEKLIPGIPEINPLARDVTHGPGDIEEMLEELGGNVFVDRIGAGQFERDGHHVQAEHTHPTGAVALLDKPAVGSAALRSKTPMLSSPRKPPSKTLLPSASLRLTHQVKLIS